MKAKTVRLKIETIRALKARAEKNNLSVSEVLRELWREAAPRGRVVAANTEEVSVRIDDKLEHELTRAAKKARMPLARWLRLAVEEGLQWGR